MSQENSAPEITDRSASGDWPHTALSRRCRWLFHYLAGALSWIWLALIAVVVINVIMRYLFGEGRIEFEEIQWHLYATGFMLGLATCMDTDQHVRVDVLHDRASAQTRAYIELYGLLLLFLPFVLAMLIFALPFVSYSFAISEVSDAPGGLPGRWLIKGMLPLAMTLLLVAGISRLSRILAFLFGWPHRVD
ncbi:MAG: TRAP transporter small permease subunit [Lysobacterales bacterium]